MFGGVGPDIVRGQDPGARYQPNVENGVVREFGWNNEYYEFNMKTREQFSILVFGVAFNSGLQSKCVCIYRHMDCSIGSGRLSTSPYFNLCLQQV